MGESPDKAWKFWWSHQIFLGSWKQAVSLKDYSTCIETYTQSILSCPEKNEVEQSLALANRSAALFQLELYEDCLKDIKMAISKKYPSHLLPKILVRKIKSLKKLGIVEDLPTTLEELATMWQHIFSDIVTLLQKFSRTPR